MEREIMYKFTADLNKTEYDNFVENYSMASFMQQYEWGEIKDNWKSFHCGLYKDERLVAVCLVLMRKVIKNINLFYIPRGYLIDFTNFEDLKEFTNNIKKLAKSNHAYVVKLDPNFCISDDSLKGEKVEHNYSENYEIKNSNLLKLGYKNTGLHKEMSKNFQPQYNMFSPLCDTNNNIYDLDGLLKTYKSKFRYYIGAFHEKRGITFEISDELSKVDELVEMLKLTEEKQNITLRNKEYFEKIMTNYKGQAYIAVGYIDLDKYIAFLKESEKEDEIQEALELKEQYGSKITLSASLLILPKNKEGIRTSEYLYAGNNSLYTKLKPSMGIVYELLKFSAQHNCHYCNLGGVDGGLEDHLADFKRKFNARVMVFCGEYDLPTSAIYYPVKLFYPILLKLYKKIKRG